MGRTDFRGATASARGLVECARVVVELLIKVADHIDKLSQLPISVIHGLLFIRRDAVRAVFTSARQLFHRLTASRQSIKCRPCDG